jgi:AraC-like DNA-binding protein
VEAIAAQITVSGGDIGIHTLSAEFGYSIRTLDRHFQQVYGISPKFYARLVRFQRAVALITANPHHTLLDIVFTCGYFDQAHFTHDFKAFSGQSPNEYRRTTLQKFAHHQNYVQFLQEQMIQPL